MSGTSSSNNLVLQVLQMAKITFARKLSANPLRRELVLPPDEFKANLRELKQLMTGLKSSDLGLEHSETIKGTSGRRSPLSGLFRRTANEAPVTYIKVLEDIDVSIGIFIVKAGSRLPLHNHPNMYGLLKVVYGMVDVKIYSKFESKSGEEDKLELPTMLQEDPSLFDQGIIFPTKTQILTNVNSTHNTLLLSPGKTYKIKFIYFYIFYTWNIFHKTPLSLSSHSFKSFRKREFIGKSKAHPCAGSTT